jgi:MFS family permease
MPTCKVKIIGNTLRTALSTEMLTKSSWLGTILYIGVLAGELPTNFLLQKLPVAKYLACNVFLWGVIIATSASATNFGGLMAVRFLLGMFESCVQPAFILM